LHGKAQPAKSDDCIYALRNTTLHGDSGSALLTPQGLVDAIAIQGAESGGAGVMAEMKVLPLSCVRDLVLNAVSDSQSDKIMNIVWNGSDYLFRDAFQPPPWAGSGWVSNLRLAKAFLGWSAANKTQTQLFDVERRQKALKIIYERRLGIDMLRALAVAETTNTKNAGDAFQRLGDGLIDRSKADAQIAYSAAKYVAGLTPAPLPVGAKPPERPDLARAFEAPENTPQLARIIDSEDDLKQRLCSRRNRC
jgi:hypothetical protein